MLNFNNLPAEKIKTYLEKLGWRIIPHTNPGIFFFEAPEKLNKPISLVFPRSNSYDDYNDRINSVLKTLSIIYKKSIDEIAKEIIDVYFAVFKALINKGQNTNKIPLNFTRITINNLYFLLLYGYSFEFNPVAYFLEAPKKAKDTVSKLSFPHTFKGSFGFSVELGKEESYLFENDEITIEEKVIDRIFTGFQNLTHAIKENNESIIVNNYQSGFNANMCDALANIARKLDSNTITFDASFLYKKRNLNIIKPYILKSENYEILEQASITLKEQNPILDVTIEGYVIATQDKNKDLLFRSSKDQKRTVTISGTIKTSESNEISPSKNRKTEIIIELNEIDYNSALGAHKDLKKVSIKGDLYKKAKYELRMPKVKQFLIESNK